MSNVSCESLPRRVLNLCSVSSWNGPQRDGYDSLRGKAREGKRRIEIETTTCGETGTSKRERDREMWDRPCGFLLPCLLT